MGMADRIKERRIAIGLTQEELGEKLGLQKSAIAKYENGRVENIKRSTIKKMADILGCSPCYLMGWTDQIKVVPKQAFDLSEDEQKLIVAYRNTDQRARGIIKNILQIVAPDDDLEPIAAHAHDGATPEELEEDAAMLERHTTEKGIND